MNEISGTDIATGDRPAATPDAATHHGRDTASRRWRLHVGLLALVIVLIAVAYWSTLTGIVSIWIRSETFAHGFLIFPIVAWLIFRIRGKLANLQPRVGWLGLPMLLGIGFIWALGHTADALVVQQFAFVGMIVASTWLLLGRELVWEMAFPLGFMFLAVPAGEFLIPQLMHFTAMFTVEAIRLTGIPVYWEGTRITLPTGTWSVIKACSGIRYLMATLTVALLYGYLTYRSYWRRVAFLLLGIVVAVVGNGLRAYGIVMLGYLSDMRIAVGFDHIIYGWLFFGVLVAALLFVGQFWQEAPEPAGAEVSGLEPSARSPVGTLAPMVAALAGIVLIAMWPVRNMLRPVNPVEQIPAPVFADIGNGWLPSGAITEWRPRYSGYAEMVSRTYRKGSSEVGLYVAWYPAQGQGHEVINFMNTFVSERDKVWDQSSQESGNVSVAGTSIPLDETVLHSSNHRLLVWRSNWIAGHWVTNPFYAKFIESVVDLLKADHRAAAVFVYTALNDDSPKASARLKQFLHDNLPTISSDLDRARPGTP